MTDTIEMPDKRKNMLFEAFCRKNETRQQFIIIASFSIILLVICCTTLGIIQYQNYVELTNNITNTESQETCAILDYGNFEIVLSTISLFIMIVYVVLHKRRSLLRNKFAMQNIGLPSIVSCWNKTDRFYTSIVYGRIAYEVYKVIIFYTSKPLFYVDTSIEPSGVLLLLIQIIKVFIVGLRYYPVLVTFCAKETILYIFTCLYMWFDLFETLFGISVCDRDDVPDIKILLSYYLAQKILQVLPTLFFSSYIVVNLTYRSIRSLVRFFKDKDSKSIFDIDNDDEIFYCHTDVDYVINVLNKKNDKPLLLEDDGINDKTEMKSKNSKKTKFLSLFDEFVYDWQPNFKFSSRFVNTQTVALVVLYHLLIFIFYKLLKIYFYLNDFVSNATESSDDDSGITKEAIDFIKSIQTSLNMILFIPLFFALVITLLQFFLAIKDCKKHILQIFKGKCDYIPPRNKLTNGFISGIF
jgi:hypothetical protein